MKQSSGAESLDVDVAIVGAGMTGAAMALSLADTGLRLAVLDGQPLLPLAQAGNATVTVEDFDPRVSAITAASQRQFEALGLWNSMLASRVSPYLHMHVREADGTGSIDFAAADIHVPALGHIIENRVITGAMHERLRQQPNLQLWVPVQVTACEQHDQGVKLTLADGSMISAGLVIAADGANSQLRQLGGFQTREWDYEHQAIVTTVRTSRPHQQTARQIFMDEGVLAFLPLSAGATDPGMFCSIVWSVVPERAAELMSLDEAAFRQALGLASEHWLGDIEEAAGRYSFPLRQRHAKEYFRGRLVLIGDAAHSIHPLAGQGANLGLSDVRVLAEELHHALQARRALHDPVVLSRYQRRRKGDNLAMMAVMEGFKRLYGPQPLWLRWLRNSGMRAVDHLPALKNQLIREAMG